jgi:hypothetical protein
MRWWLAFAVACGGSSTTKAIDAQPSVQACEAAFDTAVDRSCVVAGDCALIAHPDCCGDVEIGVARSGLATADPAEARYDTCNSAACGARGCAHATESEDGMVPQGSQTIVAVCTNNRCSSTVQ